MPTAQLDFTRNIAGWWREVKDDFWACHLRIKRGLSLTELRFKRELVLPASPRAQKEGSGIGPSGPSALRMRRCGTC
jgi:hypothetical protein